MGDLSARGAANPQTIRELLEDAASYKAFAGRPLILAALELLNNAERNLREVVRIASPFDECTPADLGPAETDELFISAFEALSALVGDGTDPAPRGDADA